VRSRTVALRISISLCDAPLKQVIYAVILKCLNQVNQPSSGQKGDALLEHIHSI